MRQVCARFLRLVTLNKNYFGFFFSLCFVLNKEVRNIHFTYQDTRMLWLSTKRKKKRRCKRSRMGLNNEHAQI